MMPVTKTTLKILAMPASLTNRQVADIMGIDIEIVKDRRRYHKTHKPAPRDRGYKALILAKRGHGSAKEIAQMVGCTARYVSAIWQQEIEHEN